MNWKTTRQFSLQLILLAAMPATAQNQALDEDFLLFLASGMEINGTWQDPVSLSELVEVQAITDNGEMPSVAAAKAAAPEEERTDEN